MSRVLTGVIFLPSRGAYRYVRLLLQMHNFKYFNVTVPRAFKKTVSRYQHRPAIIFEDRKWSFLELERYSNRVAHYFLRMGYKPGECVALFMDNRWVGGGDKEKKQLIEQQAIVFCGMIHSAFRGVS